MKYIKQIIVIIFLFLITYFAYLAIFSKNKKIITESIPKHHTVDGFQNHPFVETASSKGVAFYLRRFWDSMFVPDVPEGHKISESEAIKLLNSVDGDSITWLGHASFLITVAGKTILTDPFLTEFASPVSWAGPRRFVEPGISIDNLPAIDIVMVSHNHYDHLDDETVKSLKNKDKIIVVVPLGLKEFFTKRGYKNVIELDWNKSTTIDDIKLTAVPAVHDSARSAFDVDETLWASWVIENDEKKIFFAGDTGYENTIFKNIGKKFNSFDYAILPIGAYEPRELMWMSHITPKEAVIAGKELNAEKLIASHWGTISSLSDEPMWEPPEKFKEIGISEGLLESSLWVMKIGETRHIVVY